ncbi:MAG TPA: two-component regulator propeller domain-containing protein [Bacteroidia bacterium]|jgi:ligand-binding sensor domain-containing protein
MKKINLLFVIVIIITSCTGQVHPPKPKEMGYGDQTSNSPAKKLLKPSGIGSGANVHCAIQDKTGKLWFGTTGGGVYMFDGEAFTNFTVNDGLSNNFVWCITEDTTGNIWFGTGDGACRYNGKTFTAVPISVIRNDNFSPLSSSSEAKLDSYGNPLEENGIWDIFQDKKGTFWFGTSDGIYQYTGGVFNRFLINDTSGLKVKKVERILEDKAGNIWFSGRMNEGVFCFDGKSLTSFNPDGKNWFWPVLEDRTGNIWFSNWTSVYRYDGKIFTSITKQNSSCMKGSTCIIQDRNGNIWCGNDGENGLCRFDGKSFIHYTQNESLSNNSVWCIVEDSAGKLWIGTRNMGLNCYDGKAFTIFSE